MSIWLAALAYAISAAALGCLAWRDPKRVRSLRRAGRRCASRSERRLLAAIALAPGLVLALGSLWSALLIWFGALLASGWLLALWLVRAAVSASAGSPTATASRPRPTSDQFFEVEALAAESAGRAHGKPAWRIINF